MKSPNKVSSYLQIFHSSQLAKAETPTLHLLSVLKSLSATFKQKQLQTENTLNAYANISREVSLSEIEEYKQIKQQISENQQIIKLMQICRDIDIKIVEFQQNIQMTDFDQFDRLTKRLSKFRDVFQLIQKINQQFKLLEQNSLSQNVQNIVKLKGIYFIKLKSKLYKAIVQLFYSHQRNKKLQESFEFFALPFKKQKNEQYTQKSNQNSLKYKNLAYCVIEALFCEYCCYCLHKTIEMQLGEQTQQKEIISIIQSNQQSFKSPFFTQLWNSVFKSILYIFINSPNMNQQNNAYQIDQPNWMFQYLERTFQNNYNFIIGSIIVLITMNQNTKEIAQFLQTYFVSYNLKNFFLKLIIIRLENDIKVLKEQQKYAEKGSQNEKAGFIIFNFLDELYVLQEKIKQKYNHEPNFIQSVLIWAQKIGLDILTLNFDYEHNWIQEKIFSDFYNINYSSISNLKNVQAYNITINFIHIFEKLYGKFRKVTNEQIKNKINSFYYEQILKLVRHIKTSFQRIYKNTGVDKYETLISYKKVEDQFRGYFDGFIQQSPNFEQKVQKQYYLNQEQYLSVFAIEQLTHIHKKMYKKLTEYTDFFSGKEKLQNNQQIKKKMHKIFEQWQQIVFRIKKIDPQYQDKKMRNIFFVFSQGSQFSEQGYHHFIQIFEPFMFQMFSVEGTKIIKSLFEMQKGTLRQYLKNNQNNIWFLDRSEIQSIVKTKIRPSNTNTNTK